MRAACRVRASLLMTDCRNLPRDSGRVKRCDIDCCQILVGAAAHAGVLDTKSDAAADSQQRYRQSAQAARRAPCTGNPTSTNKAHGLQVPASLCRCRSVSCHCLYPCAFSCRTTPWLLLLPAYAANDKHGPQATEGEVRTASWAAAEGALSARTSSPPAPPVSRPHRPLTGSGSRHPTRAHSPKPADCACPERADVRCHAASSPAAPHASGSPPLTASALCSLLSLHAGSEHHERYRGEARAACEADDGQPSPLLTAGSLCRLLSLPASPEQERALLDSHTPCTQPPLAVSSITAIQFSAWAQGQRETAAEGAASCLQRPPSAAGRQEEAAAEVKGGPSHGGTRQRRRSRSLDNELASMSAQAALWAPTAGQGSRVWLAELDELAEPPAAPKGRAAWHATYPPPRLPEHEQHAQAQGHGHDVGSGSGGATHPAAGGRRRRSLSAGSREALGALGLSGLNGVGCQWPGVDACPPLPKVQHEAASPALVAAMRSEREPASSGGSDLHTHQRARAWGARGAEAGVARAAAGVRGRGGEQAADWDSKSAGASAMKRTSSTSSYSLGSSPSLKRSSSSAASVKRTQSGSAYSSSGALFDANV